MKLIVLCALFVGLSSAHEYKEGMPKNLNCNCGWINSDNDIVKYPWVVAIYLQPHGMFLCVGTIMTKRHILSSADCLYGYQADTIEACSGSKDYNRCGARHRAKNISVHGGFDSRKSKNNLAIIRVVGKIKFDKFTGPACYPYKSFSNDDLESQKFLFLGWGEGDRLRSINFDVRGLSQCKDINPLLDKGMHVCVAAHSIQNSKKDAGGAFLMLDGENRYTVMGVLERWSTEYKYPAPPSLVTNFTLFRYWTWFKVLGKGRLCHRKLLAYKKK